MRLISAEEYLSEQYDLWRQVAYAMGFAWSEMEGHC
jgi:hypothetical protein